jgi:hypothetical protein
MGVKGPTMNLWGSPDRFLAMRDAAERKLEIEDLVTEIASGLVLAGEYVARIDLQPTQRVVDFSWAARQAGRRLGIRVDVTSRMIKADGQLQVSVTPAMPLL